MKTAGKNGPHRFTAGISTNANPRLVTVAPDVEVHADWVVRPVALGNFPAGQPVTKRIRIDNLPAGNLVRIADAAQRGWSARVGAAGERFVEVELTSTPMRLKQGESERRITCDFSLYFTSAEVRRVQVLAAALLTIDSPRSGSNVLVTDGRGL